MEEISIKEIFDAIWNRKYQVIVIIIIFLLIGFVYTTRFVSPVYSSKATLVLASTNSKENNQAMTATDVNINSKLVTTYTNLIKSRTVLEKAIENLNYDMAEKDLRKSISVKAVTGTELIEITVKNSDPEMAAKIANEITKVFTSQVKELYNIENVQLISEAKIPDSPSNVNKLRDIVLFTAVGVAVSVIYVFIINMFDTTIKSAEEIEKEFDLPVIVSIPLMENDKIKKGAGKNE